MVDNCAELDIFNNTAKHMKRLRSDLFFKQ